MCIIKRCVYERAQLLLRLEAGKDSQEFLVVASKFEASLCYKDWLQKLSFLNIKRSQYVLKEL